MRKNLEGNKLTLFLEGRIDTNNAPEVEKELLEAVAEAPDAEPVLDAEGLEYISSAGLRGLMKLRKQTGKVMSIRNVSSDVYEIFQTTGFTDLFDVQKRLRVISVEGCEKIGEGGNGKVFRLDEDKIVKVYKPWMQMDAIERERSFARTAFINGIPSVIAYDTVKVPQPEGECLGIVFEMLDSDTLGHAMAKNPEKLPEFVDRYVELARSLHTTHVPEGSFTKIQDVAHGYADNLGQWCSREEIELLHGIVDSIPEADTVVHNDLHPGNIMIQNGELILIDMPAVTMGPPVCDLMTIFRDMISAPKRSPEHIVHSIGMPADLILKAGNLFFMKYTGITDPGELEAFYKKLGLLYSVDVVLFTGSGNKTAMERADQIMNNLLRPVVIPNEQTIKYLFRTLVEMK